MLILAAPPDHLPTPPAPGPALGGRWGAGDARCHPNVRAARLAFISARITRACAAAQLAAIRVGAAPLAEGRSRPTHRERPTAGARAAAGARWRHHGPGPGAGG